MVFLCYNTDRYKIDIIFICNDGVDSLHLMNDANEIVPCGQKESAENDRNYGVAVSATKSFKSYHNLLCKLSTSVMPHKGDGNNRFGDGYSWIPDIMQVDFKNNYSNGKNRVELYYEYFSSTDYLDNLQYDSDEGLELEVVFYNYGKGYGSTYQGNSI